MEPYQSNSVMTNLSFANENSSHVLFCNTQNSVENHLGKELHHLGKELHRFGILKVWEFQKWKKVPLKIFLMRFN